MAPTFRFSPGSEDSTLPSNPSDTDASDRSNGTNTVPLFSNDTGPESRSSETLLPTPKAQEAAWTPEPHHQPNHRAYNAKGYHKTWGVQQVASILSAVDSPASQQAPQDDARVPMTTAGYGLSSPESLASYDPETSSWRTSQVSLLSTEDERFPRSWERWPTSGMTRRGQAFALVRSAHHTAGSGSSSLPTPSAGLEKDARLTPGMGNREHSLGNLMEGVARLLHSPTATDKDGRPRYDHQASPGYVRNKPVPNLMAQVTELLPTVTTDDANNVTRASGDFQSLAREIHSLGDHTNPRSDDGSK